MSVGTHTIALAGTKVALRSDRTIYWSAQQTLVAADIHLGKAATFQTKGVAIPEGITASDLDRLTQALNETNAQRLIIVGDLYHGPAAHEPLSHSQLRSWRKKHRELDIHLVKGNHDVKAGPPPRTLEIEVHAREFVVLPFAFRHQPGPSQNGYVIAGHLHPGYVARPGAGDRLRLPCFHIRDQWTVLPAFSQFTGLSETDPLASDTVVLVAGDELVALPG